MSEVTLLLIIRFVIKQCSLQTSARRQDKAVTLIRGNLDTSDMSQEERRPVTQISTPSPQPASEVVNGWGACCHITWKYDRVEYYEPVRPWSARIIRIPSDARLIANYVSALEIWGNVGWKDRLVRAAASLGLVSARRTAGDSLDRNRMDSLNLHSSLFIRSSPTPAYLSR